MIFRVTADLTTNSPALHQMRGTGFFFTSYRNGTDTSVLDGCAAVSLVVAFRSIVAPVFTSKGARDKPPVRRWITRSSTDDDAHNNSSCFGASDLSRDAIPDACHGNMTVSLLLFSPLLDHCDP